MTRSRSAWLGLCWLLLLAVARAEVVPVDTIDSAAVLAEFATHVGGMVEQQQMPGMGQLRGQLASAGKCRLATTAPVASALPPQELFTRCRQSVVLVGIVHKCPKCTRWHTRAATGFVVGSEGAICTAYHVLASDKDGQGMAVRSWDGRIWPVEKVLAANRERDLLILKVAAGDLVPLPIAGQAAVGSRVWCVGHANHHLYLLTEGIVAGYFQRGPRVDMAVTADFARGSSGAPVLDSSGAVVGMARATQTVVYDENDKTDNRVQMTWKYCVPSAYLLSLLQ